jgi:hypothetical protein
LNEWRAVVRSLHVSTSRVHRFLLVPIYAGYEVELAGRNDHAPPTNSVLTAVESIFVVSCPIQCCCILAQTYCLPPSPVRFGSLHSKIESHMTGAARDDKTDKLTTPLVL